MNHSYKTLIWTTQNNNKIVKKKAERVLNLQDSVDKVRYE